MAARKIQAVPGGWPDDAPPRSRLFNLPPSGFDGQSREELRSYFRRLCAAHRMRPWTMANRVVIPAALERDVIDVKLRADQCFDVALAGVTSLAALWADTLNALSRRHDLQLLTLLPLKALLPTNKLITAASRFCPRCYESDEATGREKYDRLLWTIDAVKACPVHEVLLVEGERMSDRVGFLPFFAPGVCRSTGESLASRAAVSAPPLDVDGAQRIAALLDEAVFIGEHAPESVGVRAFLQHAIASLFDGNSARFAAHLGVSKSQVHGWLHEKSRPSLPRLVQIAQACDCGISDILLGNRSFLRAVPTEHIVAPQLAPKRRAGAGMPREDLLCTLQRLDDCGSVTTMREAAARLDVSEKFLRNLAPDICDRIVERGIQMRRLASQERQDALGRAYLAEHSALRGRGIYPSRRKVVAGMKAKCAISYRFPDLQRAQREAMRLAPVSKRRASVGTGVH
ncbi:helix-turn-helix domain-containing protein [Ralstonia solanacearum]|uniref:helix-turn-helix domain-containing protein n=1 Tax=Ralstonia solanacearum TaxID=305 RepID=UPI0018D0E73C|nr:TniQ family protein [Ralstonia solanacearum]